RLRVQVVMHAFVETHVVIAGHGHTGRRCDLDGGASGAEFTGERGREGGRCEESQFPGHSSRLYSGGQDSRSLRTIASRCTLAPSTCGKSVFVSSKISARSVPANMIASTGSSFAISDSTSRPSVPPATVLI